MWINGAPDRLSHLQMSKCLMAVNGQIYPTADPTYPTPHECLSGSNGSTKYATGFKLQQYHQTIPTFTTSNPLWCFLFCFFLLFFFTGVNQHWFPDPLRGPDQKFEIRHSSQTPTIQYGISRRQSVLCSKRLINKRTFRTQPIRQPEPVCNWTAGWRYWLGLWSKLSRVLSSGLVPSNKASDARYTHTKYKCAHIHRQYFSMT